MWAATPQLSVFIFSKSAGGSLRSVDEHRTTGLGCGSLTGSHCACTQVLAWMLECHYPLGLSLNCSASLLCPPVAMLVGGARPARLVCVRRQKSLSLDLVSSLFQNLPAVCQTELSLFHPVLQDLLLSRWWSQPCLERRWLLQWESSAHTPWRPRGAGEKL